MNKNEKKKVIFTYQGAFGPPTFGHYKCMEIFTEKVINEYDPNTYDITMLFMPTAASSSKPHLKHTQELRVQILNDIYCSKLNDIYCSKLNEKYSNITFKASDLEMKLYDKRNKDTSTIHTLRALKKFGKDDLTQEEINKIQPSLNLISDTIILVGMGKDNMEQLPYWKDLKDYGKLVEKIYAVNREGINDNLFEYNKTGIYFQKTPPSWYENRTEIDLEFLNNNTEIKETLGSLELIDGTPPDTSSSMMRHFIGKNDRKKVKTILFGNELDINENLLKIIMNTDVFQKEDNDKSHLYENQYNNFISNLKKKSGGKRRKTKRKKNRKKRRSYRRSK